MERDNRRPWQEPNLWVPVLAITAVIGAALFFWPMGEKSKEPVKEETTATSPDDLLSHEQAEEPKIQFPVPGEAGETAGAITQSPGENTQQHPSLDESDAFIEEEFHHLYDEQKFGGLFLLQDIIRNSVVTIDNMTGPKLPQKYSFTQPPAGRFVVFRDAAGNEFIDPKNYDRYRTFVELAMAVDIRRIVSFYVRYYTAFQQAYRDLGYPDRYFNDRVIAVLDHLLAAPEIKVPIKLVRPKVFYQFADPDLEALSAGQKILVRIGPDNAGKVKARLKELRQSLATLKKKK